MNGFQATTIQASGATVRAANGVSLGTGIVTLATAVPVPVSVSGNNQYRVSGHGRLAFFGPSETALGVGGDWQNYSAIVVGGVTLALTTDGLILNGTPLPAGTYTVTAPSAALGGSGRSSSPNFAGSVSIDANDGTVELGPGTGSVAVGGKPLDPKNGATFTGYSGTITVTANGNATDTVTFHGNAAEVLTVAATPAAFTTDQNTPVTFRASVRRASPAPIRSRPRPRRAGRRPSTMAATVTATPRAGPPGRHVSDPARSPESTTNPGPRRAERSST